MPKPVATPPVVYAVRPHGGRPTLFINGQPDSGYAYNYCGSFQREGAPEIYRKFIANGCRTFVLCLRGGVEGDWGTTPFWTDDNVFPDNPLAPSGSAWQETLDTAKLILDVAPDARFWLRCNCSPPKRWVEKYPDDLLLNSYGKRYTEPSLASDRYDAQVGRFIENLVGQCERLPWADRLIGYLVYPLGEGTTQLTCEGYLFDQSPVMLAGFRAWLQRHYGSDVLLQTAWQRPDVTLASARLPHDADFRQRGQSRQEKIGSLSDNFSAHGASHRLHWPDPAETAVERDYCSFMRELTERNFRTLLQSVKRQAPQKLAGIDAFKQSMLGWPLMARHAGDYAAHAGSMHPVSGAFAMADLLGLPELDVVATPHDYLNRGMGFGYEGEGIGDSIVLHEKMMFMEEDQRTYCLPDGTERWNMLHPGPEIPAGLWRNFGASLTRGYNTYPMDVMGKPSFFSGDDIQAVLRERGRVQRQSVDWQRAEVPSIVMVIDDTSVLEEDFTFNYQYLAVIQQRMYGLSRCGVPFRLHLFEDLARENFPSCHKVFLFPNLFRLTPERMELIRQRVLRQGNVAIFGPATGITDGTRLRSDLASELLGIPLDLRAVESPRVVTIDRFDHPITAGLQRRIDYGDSYPYGPLLMPGPHAEVRRLGGIQWASALDGAGLVIREFGRGAAGSGQPGPRGVNDYATIFSAAVPLPDLLLREMARYSGTHVYGEGDDLIFADSATVCVHSVRPGRRVITLPRASAVWDLIEDRQVSARTTTITLEITGPQTHLFHLEEVHA